MQKGYKREGRGMAVLRCFIGLFIMIVVILLAYFMLRLDYSDKLDPNTSMRPYVEITPSPVPSAAPAATEAPAITEATATPNATDKPMATAAPTAEPTEAPTPEPTPEATATPEPTQIPSSSVAEMKISGYKLPSLSSKDAQLGITHCYRSAVDDYRYMHVQGYAYVDDSGYDGSNADIYLVAIRSTGHTALILPTKINGVSGSEHASAQCANASASDFDVVIDVSKFPDDSYTLGMVFMYNDANTGKTLTEYFTFPSEMTFSVLSKQAVSDIKTTSAE